MVDELLNYETDDEKLKALLTAAAIKIRKLEKQIADDSWISSPDRSGGQFTYDEINHDRW